METNTELLENRDMELESMTHQAATDHIMEIGRLKYEYCYRSQSASFHKASHFTQIIDSLFKRHREDYDCFGKINKKLENIPQQIFCPECNKVVGYIRPITECIEFYLLFGIYYDKNMNRLYDTEGNE